MQILLLSEFVGMLARFLKVLAELNQVRALSSHGGVLFSAVAVRHDDGHRHLESLTGQSDRLAVVAASGGNQSFDSVGALEQFRRVDDCASRLEGTDGSMVLVLDPHIHAEPMVEQRPGNLRRGLHERVDQLLRFLDLVQRGQ